MSRPKDKKHRHLPKFVTVIHGSYWYRPPAPFKGDPVPKPVKLGRAPDELYRVFEFMKGAQLPTKPITNLSHCFERYKIQSLPKLSPRTQEDYLRHLAYLDERFGKLHPNQVKSSDVGSMLDDPTRGKVQLNQCSAVLSQVYKKAIRWGASESNPVVGIERNQRKPRTRYITDDEFDAFSTFAPIRIELAMELALLTGQRLGDILKMQWTDVSDKGITFLQGKTGKGILVKMSKRMKQALERARRLEPLGPTVIRNRKGAAYVPYYFGTNWCYQMRQALKQGVVKTRFTFHDIRAKCVSDSKSLVEAYERAGHQDMRTTRGTYDRAVRIVNPLL